MSSSSTDARRHCLVALKKCRDSCGFSLAIGQRHRASVFDDDFRLAEAEVPRPGPGQLLLRTIYLSLDPYMGGRMNAGPSYARPVEVGAVMEGRGVAEVVESNLPGYQPGDVVFAPTGWQEYAISDG